MWALFTEDELHEAVKRTLGEEKLTAVVASSHVSRSTLKRALVARKRGDSLERKRPGPKPLLPAKCEEDLVTWIAAMQRTMFPVHPWELLEIANELNRSIRGNLRSVTDLTYGCRQRRRRRYLTALHLARKAFEQGHFGWLFPPRRRRHHRSEKNRERGRVRAVNRPLCGQYPAARPAAGLVPPNATHLVRPLYVAAFRGYKREIQDASPRALQVSGAVGIKNAIAVASAAYNTHVVSNTQAAINGFRTCGLFPPSIPAMLAQLKKSSTNEITKSELSQANWLRVRDEARVIILALPPSPARKKGS